MKRSSFSYKMRQSLSDITNSQSQEEEHKNLQGFDSESIGSGNKIIKENVALVKLLEEREYELRKLQEGIRKLQVQNWSLAQTNTLFLAEINLARNKVKALQHEVTCKNALLKAKCCEQEEVKNTQLRNVITTKNVLVSTEEESEKPSLPNRRRNIRSESLGESPAHNIDDENQKFENKRRSFRRKSTRVRRTATQEVTESLFEIEDLELAMPNRTYKKYNSTTASHTQKKEDLGIIRSVNHQLLAMTFSQKTKVKRSSE